MKVELSAHEMDMIDKALVCYQNEPGNKGMSTMMLSAIFAREENREDKDREMQRKTEEIQDETRKRERQVLLLRARLMQAATINSDHELTEPAR